MAARIYLDLNILIALAKADHDSDIGTFLRFLQDRVASNVCVCPFSFVHLAEITKVHREDQIETVVRQVLLPLSRGECIRGFPEVFRLEVENMLCRFYSLPLPHKFPDAAFGYSVAAALGYTINGLLANHIHVALNDPERMIKFILRFRGRDSHQQIQEEYREATDTLRTLRVQHYGKPKDKLRQENLKAQEELRYLPVATAVLSELRSSGRVVTDPPPPLLKVIDELPAWDVYQSLEFEMHKPSVDREPELNDLRDLAFACVAIPYCDAVIADKHLIAIARDRLRLDRKWGTRLFTLAEAKARPGAILE
jgi:hypothetical protein